jgi:hypothetical protein
VKGVLRSDGCATITKLLAEKTKNVSHQTKRWKFSVKLYCKCSDSAKRQEQNGHRRTTFV